MIKIINTIQQNTAKSNFIDFKTHLNPLNFHYSISDGKYFVRLKYYISKPSLENWMHDYLNCNNN